MILPFTGLCAEEVHLCGEAAAIDLVTELMYTTGEEVEVHASFSRQHSKQPRVPRQGLHRHQTAAKSELDYKEIFVSS